MNRLPFLFAILMASLAARQALAAEGDVFVEPKSGARYRLIPPGTFTMGCSEGDDACESDEARHDVTIARSFFLAETETTNAQYRRCVNAGVCALPSDLTWFDDPTGPDPNRQYKAPRRDHPVVFVSWNDAATFCRWSGGRLPSEAEWEYAARGGKEGLRYERGTTISRGDANYGRDDCCSEFTAGFDRWKNTAPAGSFAPNGFGLFDMSGNVWEWVADWYDHYEEEATRQRRVMMPGKQRVLRGGSWYADPRSLRVSNRGASDPSVRSSDYGFRCARDGGQ